MAENYYDRYYVSWKGFDLQIRDSNVGIDCWGITGATEFGRHVMNSVNVLHMYCRIVRNRRLRKYIRKNVSLFTECVTTIWKPVNLL